MVKKIVLAGLLAAFLFVNVGCYGSFALTKKIYEWNSEVGDKWIQSAVMWVMIVVPVYPACAFIDVLALNTIEFWTGNNPVALTSPVKTEREVAVGEKRYRVTMGGGELTICATTGPDAGRRVTLAFNKRSSTVQLRDATTSHTIATINPHPVNTIDLAFPDGRIVTKTLYASSAVAMHE